MILAAGPAGSALEDAGYLEIVRAMDLILAPGQVTEPRALGVSTLAYRQPYTIKRMSLKEMRPRTLTTYISEIKRFCLSAKAGGLA
jgi:hypothetical protein